MPYDIYQQENQWCVVNEDSGETVACHEDKQSALANLTALYANVSDAYQALGLDEECVGLWLSGDDTLPTSAVSSYTNSVKAVPDKYEHIDFTVTDGMVENAKRALEVRREKPDSQQGMTLVGLARARDISNRVTLSPDTWERMLSYFARHEVDKQGATWGEQGKGWQAWNGWGGDDGYARARKIVGQMDVADRDATKSAVSEGNFSGVVFGVSPIAVKAMSEDGVIEGYIIHYGYGPRLKDKQNQYFSPDTLYYASVGDTFFIWDNHAMSQQMPIPIGEFTITSIDSEGIKAKGVLYIHSEHPETRNAALRNWQEAKRGNLHWSSDSAGQFRRLASDGAILSWPIVGASVTSTPAASGDVTQIVAIKSQDVIGLQELTPTVPIEQPANEGKAVANYQPTSKSKGQKMNATHKILAALEGVGDLTADQKLMLLSLLTAEEEAEEPVVEQAVMADEMKVVAEEASMKALANQIAAKLRSAPATSAPLPATKASTRIQVRSGYEALDAADMALYAQLLNSRNKQNTRVTPQFMAEMATKALTQPNAIKAFTPNVYDRIRAASQGHATKAADMNNTIEADYGGDWTPIVYGNQLWELARIENNVLRNMESFEMPAPTFEYPIQSSDPVVYAVGETDDSAADMAALTGSPFTISRMSTDKVTFAAKKLGLQVPLSTEIEEDAIIAFIPQLRRQSERAMMDAIDNVILNADATTGTGNINYKGANTSAAPTSKFLYGGGDGMRRLPLVTNTALAINASGNAPTLARIRQAIRALRNAYSVRPRDLAMFVDTPTFHAMKSIDELLSYDINGQGSTVTTGLVPDIDGVRVFPSNELALTDATGYALANPLLGTLGQIVIAYMPAWKVGFRRNVNVDVTYIPFRDAYIMTVTARMALGRFDTQCAALLYNISVS